MSSYSITLSDDDTFIGISFIEYTYSSLENYSRTIVGGFYSNHDGKKSVVEREKMVEKGDILVAIDNETISKYSHEHILCKLRTNHRPLVLKFHKNGNSSSTRQAIKGFNLREINSISLEIARTHSTLLQIQASLGLAEKKKSELQLAIKSIQDQIFEDNSTLEKEILQAKTTLSDVIAETKKKKVEKQVLIQKVRTHRKHVKESTENCEMIGFAIRGVDVETKEIKDGIEDSKAFEFVEERAISQALLLVVQLRQTIKKIISNSMHFSSYTTKSQKPKINQHHSRDVEVLNHIEILDTTYIKASDILRGFRVKSGKYVDILEHVLELIKENIQLSKMLTQAKATNEKPV